MIEEDYVSFETAKLLKEKGFPQDPHVCNTAYTSKGNLSNNAKSFVHNSETYAKCGVKPLHYSMAPTLQMAMKWLNESHNLYIFARPYVNEDGVSYLYEIKRLHKHKLMVEPVATETCFEKSEQACEAAIKYCLENLI